MRRTFSFKNTGNTGHGCYFSRGQDSEIRRAGILSFGLLRPQSLLNCFISETKQLPGPGPSVTVNSALSNFSPQIDLNSNCRIKITSPNDQNRLLRLVLFCSNKKKRAKDSKTHICGCILQGSAGGREGYRVKNVSYGRNALTDL